jgi:hypothetical protein
MHGGLAVSANETYALAFEFFTMPLTLGLAGTNAILTWPVYPTGFVLQSAPTLSSTTWAPVSEIPVVSNNQNLTVVPLAAQSQFFRLARP